MLTSTARLEWLLDILRRRVRISFAELDHAWRNSSINETKEPLQYRTMRRHIDTIANQYNVIIKCDKSTNEYYIESDEGNLRSWVLDSIALDTLIQENKSISDRILLEHIPEGQQYLPTIVGAMKDSCYLKMRYRNFEGSEYECEMAPYFLKVHKQRWYVIGLTSHHGNEIRTFCLDRIQSLYQTGVHYKYPDDFIPENYLGQSIGIFHSDNEPIKLVLRVWEKQRQYIEKLPLHTSQTLLESNDEKDYSDYSFCVNWDEDLEQEILSKGWRYEVLAPEDFRNHIKDELVYAAKYYDSGK